MLYLSHLAMSIIVYVHSWYPWSCCSDYDCMPVDCERIKQTFDGKYTFDGIIFDRVQPSLDYMCHACMDKLGKPLCLFIQMNT